MEARKPSKFSVLGANALLGLMFAALSVLADDVPQPNVPADSIPAKAGQLDHGAAQPPKFEDLDRNKDGYVAKDEVPASEELAAKFASFDANADGKLSREEFGRFIAARGAPSSDKNRA